MPKDLLIRRSARLLLLNPQGHLLLFRYNDEHSGSFWSTAGGKLLPGESYREAALRELAEETGRSFPIGPMLRERVAVYAVARSLPARWIERYFVIRTSSSFAPSKAGWTEEEQETIRAWKWWSAGEMAESPEDFRPEWLRGAIVEGTV